MPVRPSIAVVLVLATLLLVPAAGAQEPNDFTVSFQLGLGGSSGTEDGGFGNSSYQLGFGLPTDIKTLLWVRYGEVDFGGESFGHFTGGDLRWITVAGEYRLTETFYTSGVYIGLGFYELSGRNALGVAEDDSGPGLTVGFTGDFAINDRFSILGDVGGHFADLDAASAFVTGLVGLAVHF